MRSFWTRGSGEAMADLRVEDATLAEVRSKLKTATGRLDPVCRGVKSLDAGVVGAEPLAQALVDAHGILAAELEILGMCVSELSGRIGDVGTTMHQADTDLASRARQEA
jgi:hypothetical protein